MVSLPWFMPSLLCVACCPCAVCICRYAQVLRENPTCPAEVRLGLAACLYRGGKLERASAAYKRCAARLWSGDCMACASTTGRAYPQNSGLCLVPLCSAQHSAPSHQHHHGVCLLVEVFCPINPCACV